MKYEVTDADEMNKIDECIKNMNLINVEEFKKGN